MGENNGDTSGEGRSRHRCLQQDINNGKETIRVTLPMGIVLLGFCVLGLAVATGIADTWWLQRRAKQAAEDQESFRKAA